MTWPTVVSTSAAGVLIASPSPAFREQVLQNFHGHHCSVDEAVGGADALAKLENGEWQTIVLDRRLPDLDSEELMQIIRRRFPGIQVLLLDSDKGQAFVAAEVKQQTFAKSARVITPTEPQKAVVHRSVKPLPDMIGASAAMYRVYKLATMIAPHATTVLIMGPSGTGKELVARGIHQLSARAAKPFIVVNCAAIPETLLESELFGYCRGAFTGAVQSQVGRIQAASGGTLFLDEIGELPLSMQPKLLRFLERKEVQKLGSLDVMKVDVRIVAATNADLSRKVDEGVFREDLYYRLSAFPIAMEPLCERRDDILPLAEHFLAETAKTLARIALPLSEQAIALLLSHPWRGNVRELQHVIERAVILAEESNMIRPEHLVLPTKSSAPDRAPLWAIHKQPLMQA